jgi:hypothetical protein
VRRRGDQAVVVGRGGERGVEAVEESHHGQMAPGPKSRRLSHRLGVAAPVATATPTAPTAPTAGSRIGVGVLAGDPRRSADRLERTVCHVAPPVWWSLTVIPVSGRGVRST